ncbi:MAG: hypothetical protein P8X70_01820 [Nanoarchaeota archaeon]
MKSNQKIEKQLRNKTNSKLVETIISAKKKKAWRKVAEVLSRSRKNRQNMNLSEINCLVCHNAYYGEDLGGVNGYSVQVSTNQNFRWAAAASSGRYKRFSEIRL